MLCWITWRSCWACNPVCQTGKSRVSNPRYKGLSDEQRRRLFAGILVKPAGPE
jgi:hypothetical protein